MGKSNNAQIRDGRGTNRYQVKRDLPQFEGSVTPEKFLAEREIELKPRNEKQRKYIQEIHDKNHVIATGFAGTSKTFIPTMIASQMLRNKQIDRIILIRTPVSDEESVGMLKGTVEDKTKYWLMPILDTLNKALSSQLVDYLIKREQIVCLPPEFLKGVSFSPRDFVIFDEVEDISKSVAIASVTRQGGGKLVMCGDLRQKMISLESGLPLLLDVVRQSPSLQNRVGLIEFDSFEDIVRSDDCKEWVKAFVKLGYM